MDTVCLEGHMAELEPLGQSWQHTSFWGSGRLQKILKLPTLFSH